MQVRDVPLDEVRLDGDTQPRRQIDMAVVADYAADMDAGADFPPGEAVFDGTHYWLWDGFHRLHAERRRESTAVRLNVRPGTVEDARWLALGANKAHGLRRTNEDKRRAVEGALRMRPDLSNVQLAEHCGVSHNMVAEYRSRLSSDESQKPERTGRDGRTINTSNIGKRKESLPPAPPAEVPGPPLPFPEPEEEPEPEDDEPLPEAGGVEGQEDSLPEPVRKQTPSPVPSGARQFPHSERLKFWLHKVADQTHIINVELGGIGGLLAEPDKWDWQDARQYIVPMLDALGKTIEEFRAEIARHANA